MKSDQGVNFVKLWLSVVIVSYGLSLLFTEASDSPDFGGLTEGTDDGVETECDDSSEEQNDTTLCSEKETEGSDQLEIVPFVNIMGVLVDDPTVGTVNPQAGVPPVVGNPVITLDDAAGGRGLDLKMGPADIRKAANPVPQGDPRAGVLDSIVNEGIPQNSPLGGIIGLRGSTLPDIPSGGLLGDTEPKQKLYETIGADVPLVVLKNDPTYQLIREKTKHNQIISLDPIISLLDEPKNATGPRTEAANTDPMLASTSGFNYDPSQLPNYGDHMGLGWGTDLSITLGDLIGVKSTANPDTDPLYSVIDAPFDASSITDPFVSLETFPGANPVPSSGTNSVHGHHGGYSLVPDQTAPNPPSLLNIIRRSIRATGS